MPWIPNFELVDKNGRFLFIMEMTKYLTNMLLKFLFSFCFSSMIRVFSQLAFPFSQGMIGELMTAFQFEHRQTIIAYYYTDFSCFSWSIGSDWNRVVIRLKLNRIVFQNGLCYTFIIRENRFIRNRDEV